MGHRYLSSGCTIGAPTNSPSQNLRTGSIILRHWSFALTICAVLCTLSSHTRSNWHFTPRRMLTSMPRLPLAAKKAAAPKKVAPAKPKGVKKVKAAAKPKVVKPKAVKAKAAPKPKAAGVCQRLQQV